MARANPARIHSVRRRRYRDRAAAAAGHHDPRRAASMTDDQFNPSRLNFARRRRGITMTRLARLVDVDVRSVSAWETGEHEPDLDKVHDLSKVLRFPVSFFFGDDLP